MNSAMGYTEGAEVPEDKTPSDNELIAQFMGFVQSKSSLGNTWEHPERMGIYGGVGLKLKYDTSWDWIMPVVEKIANTGCMVQIQIDPGFKDVASCMIAKRTKMISVKGSNLLEVTYKAVVESIKLYNLESLKNKPI